MNAVAIIPARGGSKGIKNKNIVDLNGRPLICYTIDAALSTGLFSEVIVSTDCDKIARVALGSGAKLLKRPDFLAQDSSSSIDVISHVLEEIGLLNGYFCLLQPTSPLRNAEHIREGATQLLDSGATSLISACELEHHPLKSLILQQDGTYAPVRHLTDLVSPRQALPQAIAPNGAIYFCDVACFRSGGGLFYPDTAFYLMSARESVDIDTYADLVQAGVYLSERGE